MLVPAKLLRLPAVLSLYPAKRTSLYMQMQRGLFPQSVSISGKAVAWPANEVTAVIAARIAGRSDEAVRDLVQKLKAERSSTLADLGLI